MPTPRESLAMLNRSSFLIAGALLVTFIGLFAAGVLSAAHLLDLPVPCGRSSGCSTVALHPSSQLFGVPIAFFGVGAYLTFLFLLGRTTVSARARLAFLMLSALGALISAGLLIYARTVIHATCPWCVLSGAAMTVLFGLSLFLIRRREPIAGPKPALLWSLGFATAIALGVQAGLMQKAAFAPPIPAKLLAEERAEEFIDSTKSFGPADAAVTIVEFADFSCPACRTAFASLAAFQKANPGGVRLIFRHLPFWQIRGHELSRAQAALSEMAAETGKFWQFVTTVYSQPKLDRSGYLALMQTLGFEKALIEARLADPNDPAIVRVLRDENLAERLQIQQTPTFVVLLDGHQPISANQRTLTRLLSSPEVQSRLVKAAAASAGKTSK
jgi:uncharacterized membrane protein/predicted DsbA family dithiol-disulfide isomerase